ncbi:protein kinase [Promineifilum sp.]|uniref:protein kinase domain-containing protein n=1 Tax=Promineifilum sp. TaxID=2664178 RepID=UPI0035B009A0
MAARTIGRYVVREEIGQGGMATVYRAFDPHFQRDVAIKVLPLHFLHDARFRARFEREARIVAGLQHPAIVPVYDFGEESGQPYLVMSLMSGGSLEDRLRQGPLALAETERIVGRLAPALDAAHQRGVIHRDLKPANILFDQWNEPYLTDFGIVKLTQGDNASLTTVGGIIGTPAYMSPEQVQGSEIDGRSDIYSLGIILFQMLSGRLPYDANTPIGLAFKHVSEPIPSIQAMGNARLPAEYQAVINQAMAKQPAERYQTAVALARDLTRLVHGSSPALTTVLPRDSGPLAATQRVSGGATGPGPATPAGAATAVVPPITGGGVAVAPRVERRGLPVWLWGLLALLLIGGGVGAYLIFGGGGDGTGNESTPAPTPATAVAAGVFEGTDEATPTEETEATDAPVAADVTATAGPTAATTTTALPRKTAVTPVVPTAATPRARVSAETNAYGGPGPAYPVAGRLAANDEVEVIGRTEDSAWYNVRLPNGDPAWVAAGALTALDAAAMAAVPVAGTIPAPPPTATATATRPRPTATVAPPTATTAPPTQPPPTQPPPTEPPPPPTDEPEQPTEPPPPPTPIPDDTPTPIP